MQTPLTFFFAFAVIIILIIFAAALVIALVKWIGARKTDIAGFEIVRPGGGMRRGIIRIAEGVSLLLIVVSTLIGAVLGATQSYLISVLFRAVSNDGIFSADPQAAVIFAAISGAVGGFLLTALPFSFLFTLSAIELNTRRTAAMLERLARPRTE
jgi:hypothetical protein